MPETAISRKKFIRFGIGAAGFVVSSHIPFRNAYASPHKPLATLLDVSKCIACGACVEACHETNRHKYPEPVKPFPRMYPAGVQVEDWSAKRDIDDRLTPYNWLYIQKAKVNAGGEIKEINIPRRCMHCINPPCVKLCPWGAARQFDNGIVQLDSGLCLGGGKCRSVCPWAIPQRQTGVGLYLDLMPAFAGNGVMYKCDRCYDRVAKGELPACITVCPEGVQSIGPRDEILAKARALAAEKKGYVYGDKENGGTNTFYVSPVPFEELNKSIQKGPGKPHLNYMKDVMSANNRLSIALILAPVAGVIAALGKLYRESKEQQP
jgi:Fe-S-cluster-containing dehydrogenase component